MPRLNEQAIIKLLASALRLQELDDVAVLLSRGTRLAFKCDMLVKSTDVPPGMSARQVARKSIVSCLSDFACKGIKPLAAMVALGLPPDATDENYVRGLAEGFAAASKEFAVQIVGGDTNESNDLVIDCSMIGIAPAKIPKRAGAKPGDIVVTSGSFGLPPSGLKIIMEGAKAESGFRKKAISSVLNPTPAQRFGALLSPYFSSSMDSSDGLALSLYTIAARSKRIDISLDSLPAASGLSKFAIANGIAENFLIFYGGEEYHVVGTVPKARFPLVNRIAKRNKLDLRAIGKVTRGSGKVYFGGALLENRGYTHFSSLTR